VPLAGDRGGQIAASSSVPAAAPTAISWRARSRRSAASDALYALWHSPYDRRFTRSRSTLGSPSELAS